MGRLRFAASLLGVALVTACSALPEDVGVETSELESRAVSGRWRLPSEVAAAGAQAYLDYNGAPNWGGNRTCSGSLMTGADWLGYYLAEEHASIRSIGGYVCRPNTANRRKMSVHGTGRALDIFIPKVGGDADNGRGDPIANWLVTNAVDIGVQLVIWDRTMWQANGEGDHSYGGPHPHDDHLHVELTIAGAERKTPWFREASSDAGLEAEPEAGSDAESPEPAYTDAGLPEPAYTDANSPKPEPEPKPEPDPDPDPDPEPDHADDADQADAADELPEAEEVDLLEQANDVPLIDDEPAEGESEGLTRRFSRRQWSRTDAIASSGCSATRTGSGNAAVLTLTLALAGALLRRRSPVGSSAERRTD